MTDRASAAGKPRGRGENLGRPWRKGESGNPGGRPKGFAALIRETTDNGKALVAFGWNLVGNVKAPWSVRLGRRNGSQTEGGGRSNRRPRPRAR